MYRSVLKWFQKVRVKDTFDGIPGNFKFHSQSATWEVFHVINYANIFSNNLQNFHLVCALSQNGRTFNVENIFIYQIVAHVLAMYTDPRLPSYSTCISSKRKKNLVDGMILQSALEVRCKLRWLTRENSLRIFFDYISMHCLKYRLWFSTLEFTRWKRPFAHRDARQSFTLVHSNLPKKRNEHVTFAQEPT